MVVDISDIVTIVVIESVAVVVLGVDVLCIVDAVSSVVNIVVVVVGGGVLGITGAIRMSTKIHVQHTSH